MESSPAISADRVHAFVTSAHGDLDQVRTWLARDAHLVNAAWDWGGGDWETALGGAAHMGRKDIARYLIEHGARIDIFAAAMLGEIEIVKALVEAHPGTRQFAGPHGIALMAHALAGGDEAAAVVAYLAALDGPGTPQRD